MPKHYFEEFKANIIHQYKLGTFSTQLCEQFGIARSTLFYWLKQETADSAETVPRKQYLLQKEFERLQTENAIFHSCGCSPSSPLDVRIDAILTHQGKFSIHTLCRVLQVNRSTYYYHALHAPVQTQLQIEDNQLKPLIQEVFEKSCQRFGARRIRAKLMQRGYAISERRVHRLMKELGLSVKRNHPRINSANDRQYRYYPNKLKRHFLTDAPNKVWVSDITYAKVGLEFFYLCVIIDLYSRKVIGYGISEYIDADLVIQTFQTTFDRRDQPWGLLFHSDQGTQYTSAAFRQLLKQCGVQQSFSAPGTPYDNAVAESFFASIKKEDFRQNYYKTVEEFRIAVDNYIQFYNDYRPHQRLGFLTPNQAEKEFYDSTEGQ